MSDEPGEVVWVTEPTEEWPEGSECPVHRRVHSSHGWYICLPSNGLTVNERAAALRWFAGDDSAWPEVAASIERTVSRLAREREQDPEWPECEEHEEVQHRDRKPPWCNACGWNRGRPARPARKLGTPRSERTKYRPGGVLVSGPPSKVTFTLGDEECVLDRTARCLRNDQPHLEIAHGERGGENR